MSNFRTKLDHWCEGVIEAGWLAALIVAPLFFNVFSSRVFEPDKISLVRTIALVMALAWLIKIANGGHAWLPAYSATPSAEPDPPGVAAKRLWRNPFFVPVILLVAAYLISTLFSLAPFVSWFGSYQRLQGTYSMLSYVTIALITAATLRTPDQLRRLQHAVILTSVPIAIYGIIQHYSKDPLPWGGNTTTRITANAGNAIFLAAYLIMALFLVLERIYSSFAALVKLRDDAPRGHDTLTALAGGAYVFILLIQLLAILWTQSRGPWLGLLTGGYLFVLLVLVALRPRRYLTLAGVWVGVGVLGVVLIAALNTLPIFQGLRSVPYLGRFTQLLDRESTTGQVRTLIWEGAADMVVPHDALVRPDGTTDSINVLRPLVGYGPEAMWVAFNKFYPAELSQVEARNASPDRSHNETWDSLVITGLLGFLAYMGLFLSIFYWALRWLGLLVNRRDTILFFALLLASGVVFGVAFYIWDERQLRYLGAAFPAGLMMGLLFYIMAAAFLHADFRPEQADTPRQLLIVALLSAIVAHFVEIHFGIAIAATRTYFWVYTALLVALGMRWAFPLPIAVALDVEELPPEPEPAPAESAPGKGKKARAARAPARAQRRFVRGYEPLPWTPLTVLTDVLVFLTMVFLYTTNSRGLTGPFAILGASVTRQVENGAVVTLPVILYLLLFTWGVAVLLGLTSEVLRRRSSPPAGWWVKAVLLHALFVWGAWLVYGLIQAGRVAPIQLAEGLSTAEQLNVQLERVSGHFAVFTILVILWIMVAGTVYSWSALRAPKVAFARRPLVSLVTGAATAVAVFLIIGFVNVGLVRADIVYKQGQQFDNQANWVNSAELYRRALAARPTEDHYMLFLGRALLEQAKATQQIEDAGGFPAEPTLRDVLALGPDQIAAMGRFELLRAAEAVLREAQRVNPLNTDHTANLARLYRTWADQAAGLGEAGAAMRQEKLDQSIAQYAMAVTLSPQAAHLWNEKGNAHLARGERDLAEQAYLQSLSLDAYYEQTYLLLADFYETDERFAESAALLEEGIRLIEARRGPNATLQLKSYLGVALSRTGDYTGAIEAMQGILAVQPTNQAAQRNLVLLYRDAGRLTEAAEAVEEALASLPAENAEMRMQLQSVALEIYQGLAQQNPDDYRYPLVIAQLLQEQGQLDAARPFAQQALQLAPVEQQPSVEQFLAGLGG